jgi:hypothetical protein
VRHALSFINWPDAAAPLHANSKLVRNFLAPKTVLIAFSSDSLQTHLQGKKKQIEKNLA